MYVVPGNNSIIASVVTFDQDNYYRSTTIIARAQLLANVLPFRGFTHTIHPV